MPNRQFFYAHEVAGMWSEERARAFAREHELDEATVIGYLGRPEPWVRSWARRHDLDENAAVTALRPVARRTVYEYLKRARTPGGLYFSNPPPLPTYQRDDQPRQGQIPVWVPDDGEDLPGLERRIRAWWHSRAGAGVGGGRPWPRREPCPGDCGKRVSPGSTCDECAARRSRPGRRGR
jgi:hypothetical protein